MMGSFLIVAIMQARILIVSGEMLSWGWVGGGGEGREQRRPKGVGHYRRVGWGDTGARGMISKGEWGGGHPTLSNSTK